MNPLGYLILSMYFLLKGITICVKLLGEVSVINEIKFNYNKFMIKTKNTKIYNFIFFRIFFFYPLI